MTKLYMGGLISLSFLGMVLSGSDVTHIVDKIGEVVLCAIALIRAEQAYRWAKGSADPDTHLPSPPQPPPTDGGGKKTPGGGTGDTGGGNAKGDTWV